LLSGEVTNTILLSLVRQDRG